MKKWRLIISGPTAPEENMLVDYTLWQSVYSADNVPVLRFYQWRPSAVSLGYNQNSHNVINIDFCKTNNIPVVTRPTGGSAILHDIELTYSFCGNVKDHHSFISPFDSYLSVCSGIIKGLERLGVILKVRGFSNGKEPSYTTRDCFSLSSRHDLVVNRRKLVGSAQRRNKNAFLQHGSILIDINKKLWNHIFVVKTDFSKITTLKDLLKKDIPCELLITNIKKGFEETFKVSFEESELTMKEKEMLGKNKL